MSNTGAIHRKASDWFVLNLIDMVFGLFLGLNLIDMVFGPFLGLNSIDMVFGPFLCLNSIYVVFGLFLGLNSIYMVFGLFLWESICMVVVLVPEVTICMVVHLCQQWNKSDKRVTGRLPYSDQDLAVQIVQMKARHQSG